MTHMRWRFPEGRLGSHSVGWVEEEINAWIDARIAARDQKQGQGVSNEQKQTTPTGNRRPGIVRCR